MYFKIQIYPIFCLNGHFVILQIQNLNSEILNIHVYVLTCIFIDHTQLVGLDVFLKVHTQSDSLNMHPKSAHKK